MTLDAPRTERVSTRKLKRKMSKAEAARMPSHIDVPSAPTYDPSKKGAARAVRGRSRSAGSSF